jgi:hypothetical protein
MADDDLQRLLNEVSAATGGSPQPSTSRADAARSQSNSGRDLVRGSVGGRIAFAVVASVGMGVFTWFAGLILPFTDAFSAGVGGLIAGFATAILAGPPRWFSS